jgi:arsenate reductase
MSEDKVYNVLFICTGNSARSIMAESILNREGKGRFKAFSAGSHPAGQVNPVAVDILKSMNYPIDALRSKDWAEFDRADAPELNFVFTVCDKAAGEVCPVWPGQPMTAHWGFPDPAAFEGPDVEKRAFFLNVFKQIYFRIGIFVSLPMASLDKLTLQRRLNEIGTTLPRSA